MWTLYFIIVYQCIAEFINRMEGFGGAFSDFAGYRRWSRNSVNDVSIVHSFCGLFFSPPWSTTEQIGNLRVHLAS